MADRDLQGQGTGECMDPNCHEAATASFVSSKMRFSRRHDPRGGTTLPNEPAVSVLSPAELADIEARMKANEGLVIALDARLCRVTAKRPRTIRVLTPGEAALVIAGLNDSLRLIAALSAALDENQRLRARVEAVEALISEELRNYGEAGAVAVIALRSVLSAEEASDE